MFEHERGEDGELIVRFSGKFDDASVRHLRSLLADRAAQELVLDFGRARDLDHSALYDLVANIDRHMLPVRLRGLCDTHVRMLRYFGIDVRRCGSIDAPAGRPSPETGSRS